jgi:hypothetical protein
VQNGFVDHRVQAVPRTPDARRDIFLDCAKADAQLFDVVCEDDLFLPVSDEPLDGFCVAPTR